MILKNIVLFLILALLCGCSHKRAEINRYSGFEQTISVKSTKIEIPPVLLYPRNLFF